MANHQHEQTDHGQKQQGQKNQEGSQRMPQKHDDSAQPKQKDVADKKPQQNNR